MGHPGREFPGESPQGIDRVRRRAIILCAAWAATASAADIEIRSPGFAPSKVGPDGALIESWGTVALRMVAPEGGTTQQTKQDEPMPAAMTASRAGSLEFRQVAYRAPIWPEGADVIEAAAQNHGAKPAEAVIELAVPAKMSVGETVGMIEGRPSLALPFGLRHAREEREWGCAGGVTPLRGWAKPDRACDPAFKNIAAGMGGVPIRYRFATAPGAAKTVVLGFCETHHQAPNARIMIATVEGAPPQKVDPIARWGRHVPGVLRFAATDSDRDGRLTVTVAPDASSSDHNPILNAIWLFGPTAAPDDAAILSGDASPSAERYVDVGGDADQALYPPGNLRYTIPLLSGETRQILILARCPGAHTVPDPANSVWTATSLRKAAADVWRDRWVESAITPTKPKPR